MNSEREQPKNCFDQNFQFKVSRSFKWLAEQPESCVWAHKHWKPFKFSLFFSKWSCLSTQKKVKVSFKKTRGEIEKILNIEWHFKCVSIITAWITVGLDENVPISGHLHHRRQCQPYRKQADLTLSGIKRPRRRDFASDEFQSHENFECWCSLPCGHLGGNRLATAITVPDQPWRRECVCT